MYLEGWKYGAKLVAAGHDVATCISCARLLMRIRRDDVARGFFDAVLSGVGA